MLAFLIAALLSSTIFGAQKVDPELLERGYKVYKENCSMCHREKATLWDFLRARMNVLRGHRPENIDAPPMNLVSARVKEFYPTEIEFVEFVKDYITNPSRSKGVCKPAAYAFFGTMPPIGQSMSEEEKEAVAIWLYHSYTDVWQDTFRKVKELQRRVESKKGGSP